MKSALVLWAAIIAVMGLNFADEEWSRRAVSRSVPVDTAATRVTAAKRQFTANENRAPASPVELAPSYIDVIDLPPGALHDWTAPNAAFPLTMPHTPGCCEPLPVNLSDFRDPASFGLDAVWDDE